MSERESGVGPVRREQNGFEDADLEKTSWPAGQVASGAFQNNQVVGISFPQVRILDTGEETRED